jgi:hypothetical protein
MGGIMMTLRPRLAHRTLLTFRQPKRRTYLRTVLGAIGVALTTTNGSASYVSNLLGGVDSKL